MYKRILLKLSGEQLAGSQDGGIDVAFMAWLAGEVKLVREAGIDVAIVVGGGNYVRGAQIANEHIRRTTADNMGMLATVMNALALTDVFEHAGLPTRCFSNVFANQIADSFSHRAAVDALAGGQVVVLAGGTGRPYVTTDTASVALALDLDCNAVLKATKVDGVYDKDPAKYADATRYATLTINEALANPEVKVMDRAALGLAADNHLPIVVFDPLPAGNILRAAQGKSLGTTVSA